MSLRSRTVPDPRPFLFVTLVSLVVLVATTARAADEPHGTKSPGSGEFTAAMKWHMVQDRLFGSSTPDGLGSPTSEESPAPAPYALPTSGATSGAQWGEIPPPSLWSHTTVYDPLRDRLLVFGGLGSEGNTNDLWGLDLTGSPKWQKLPVFGTPPSPRSKHSAIYDPSHDRLLVFGGTDGTYRNDVWELSLAGPPAWRLLTPGGTAPAPRAWSSTIYDPVRNRMVVFGGMTAATTFSDVWALQIVADSLYWTPLSPAGTSPGPRAASAAIYDAGRDRMVFFAGLDAGGSAHNDVFALTLGGTPTWSTITTSGTPPSPRNGTSAIYDPVRQRLVLFAGGLGAPNLNETWVLPLATTPTWSQILPANPPAGRQFHTASYDPIADRMIVFGGSSGTILSSTWGLSLSATERWIPLSGTRRRGHVAIYDDQRQRMVVMGGDDGSSLSDSWEFSLGANPAWLKLSPDGTAPTLAFHAGVYDPVRDRMVLFGGRDTAPRNATWELSFSGLVAWRQIMPVGTPPAARIDHAAVLDPIRHRMLVFGGVDALGNPFNDVWALSLSGTPTWTQILPAGTAPAGRGAASAVYDVTRDRMVIFGGYDKNLNALSDAWILSLSGTPTWTPLSATGTPPAPRFAAAAIYDPQRERMVLTGGTDFSVVFPDVWELVLFGTPAWNPLAPAGLLPQSRSDHKAIYDPADDRMVFFGGDGVGGGLLNDTWELHFPATVDVPRVPLVAVRIAPAAPNPTRGGVRFEFDSPGPGEARVAIFSVTGRRIREISSGPVPSGTHAAMWDGTDESGRRAPAGVYLYQMVVGATKAGGKLVVVD